MAGRISGGFCVLLACMLLVLPLQWVLAAVFAAIFHELCHYCAIRLCSRQGSAVHLYTFGAKLPLPPMSRKKEMLCALAGPAGSLLLLFLVRWAPRTAICGVFQAMYNLLPVYPLDGGRALQCLLSMLIPPPKAAKCASITEKVCFTGMILLSMYGLLVLRIGVLPLVWAGILILRIKFVKMPCKVGAERVQ